MVSYLSLSLTLSLCLCLSLSLTPSLSPSLSLSFPHSLSLSPSLPPGGRQYGCPPQPVLCHGSGPEAQAGNHRGPLLYGERAADPVLQVDPLQTHQDHLLQGRSSGGPATPGTPLSLSFSLSISISLSI